MTQQKSEDRTVPKGRRKSVPNRGTERLGGGKAVPVNQESWQLKLPFATAEHLTDQARADDRAEVVESTPATHVAPKAKGPMGNAMAATMEQIVEQLEVAFWHVAANRGAPGPDRRSIDDVRQHLGEILPALADELLLGTYRPGVIRRVWIPKSGGGQRGLGIPNVIDRVVQEAVRMTLEPLYEPSFHPNSHGFRPSRSCHTAIAQAAQYLEQGYEVVVDLDLEKFFDKVCHQRLLSRLV
jgi:hypothetical protein